MIKQNILPWIWTGLALAGFVTVIYTWDAHFKATDEYQTTTFIHEFCATSPKPNDCLFGMFRNLKHGSMDLAISGDLGLGLSGDLGLGGSVDIGR